MANRMSLIGFGARPETIKPLSQARATVCSSNDSLLLHPQASCPQYHLRWQRIAGWAQRHSCYIAATWLRWGILTDLLGILCGICKSYRSVTAELDTLRISTTIKCLAWKIRSQSRLILLRKHKQAVLVKLISTNQKMLPKLTSARDVFYNLTLSLERGGSKDFPLNRDRRPRRMNCTPTERRSLCCWRSMESGDISKQLRCFALKLHICFWSTACSWHLPVTIKAKLHWQNGTFRGIDL